MIKHFDWSSELWDWHISRSSKWNSLFGIFTL